MQPILAHTLVAAHANRVHELAQLYDLLAQAVATTTLDSDRTKNAHLTLGARVREWEAEDFRAELADVVTLSSEEREALACDTSRALRDAERHAQGLPMEASEHEVVRSLSEFHIAFPSALPRASLVRFRRSAARRTRLEELAGPAFLLASEARVLLSVLEAGTAPVAPRDVDFDADAGFHTTFARAIAACVLSDAGALGIADLGLGTSPALAALLGVEGEDLDEVHARWARFAASSHPFARYPYVPHARFGDGSAARRVRGDLDSTGPVGWAGPDDAATLARDLFAAARAHPSLASTLEAASARVEATAGHGQAVLGWIEYLPAEAEGQRQWLGAEE